MVAIILGVNFYHQVTYKVNSMKTTKALLGSWCKPRNMRLFKASQAPIDAYVWRLVDIKQRSGHTYGYVFCAFGDPESIFEIPLAQLKFQPL